MTSAQCAGLLVLSLAGAQSLPTPFSVEDVVRRVQARFDATADFTADVHQELVMVSTNRTFTAAGSVAFKRPGRMRWKLKDHDEQIIVADGVTLWVYEPRERQVLKSGFESAFRSSSPISFLTGVGRIDRDFTATLDGHTDGKIFLLLVPRADEGEIGRLRLTIDTASFDIVGAEVRDPLGNVTKLEFSNLRRNVRLDDELFRFEVPPGVDVIEAPVGY
jgi:outer membrane lipoprotein carrier protein